MQKHVIKNRHVSNGIFSIKLLTIVIAVLLPVAIIFTNLLALTFTDSLYKTYFKNSEDLHYAMQVVDNLRLGKPMDDNYYSVQAISHMEDVKNLVNFAKITNIVALFIIISDVLYLVKKRNYKTIKKGLMLGIILSTLCILATFICASLNFDFSFVVFHKLLFSNNNWLFAPDDRLVRLFSLDFFNFYLQKMITNILLTILVLLAIVKLIPKK